MEQIKAIGWRSLRLRRQSPLGWEPRGLPLGLALAPTCLPEVTGSCGLAGCLCSRLSLFHRTAPCSELLEMWSYLRTLIFCHHMKRARWAAHLLSYCLRVRACQLFLLPFPLPATHTWIQQPMEVSCVRQPCLQHAVSSLSICQPGIISQPAELVASLASLHFLMPHNHYRAFLGPGLEPSHDFRPWSSLSAHSLLHPDFGPHLANITCLFHRVYSPH